MESELPQPVTPGRNSQWRPSLHLEASDTSLPIGDEMVLVKKGLRH